MHMFRVASGLESMVIGEAQVLGQFKAAHRVATEAGTVDARLDYVMRRAISTAKRVRTNTSLGTGAASTQRGRGGVRPGVVRRPRRQGRPSRRRRQDEQARGATGCATGRADHDDVARRTRAAGSRGRSGAEPVALAALGEVADEVDVIIASTDSAHTGSRRSGDQSHSSAGAGAGRCASSTWRFPATSTQPQPRCPASRSSISMSSAGASVQRLDQRRADHSGRGGDHRRRAREDGHGDRAAGHRRTDDRRARRMGRGAAGARGCADLRQRASESTTETRERVEMLTRSMVRKLLHGPVTRLREARGPGDGAGDPRGVPARPLMPAAETSMLRLATRGSALALRQAALAAECLRATGRA